jgi:hypothetical protein
MREIVEGVSAGGLALMINPQWQPGNLVNDFGIGPWRRRSEDFVGSFEEVYFLKQMRIAGDNVRCASSTIKCPIGERIQYPICWYLRAWWILVGIQECCIHCDTSCAHNFDLCVAGFYEHTQVAGKCTLHQKDIIQSSLLSWCAAAPLNIFILQVPVLNLLSNMNSYWQWRRKHGHLTKSLKICCELQRDPTQGRPGWSVSKGNLLSTRTHWTGNDAFACKEECGRVTRLAFHFFNCEEN